MKALTHKIKFYLLFKDFIKTNGLRQNLTNVVVFERNGDVVIVWRTVKTKDLDTFGSRWLPLSYTIISSLSRSGIVLLRPNPKSHVSAV